MKASQNYSQMFPMGTPVEVLPHHRTNYRTEYTTTSDPVFKSRKGRKMVWLTGFDFPVSWDFVEAL